jgi:hypothetical protein
MAKLNLPASAKPSDQGQMKGNSQPDKFAIPFQEVDSGVMGMDTAHMDGDEMVGLIGDTSKYIVKKGMAYGEAAKFNVLPPGMDINDQPYRDIRAMPLKQIVEQSYSGDGGFPGVVDLNEGRDNRGTVK